MPNNDTENIYSAPYENGEGNPIPASKISYDGTGTSIEATTVQNAITEVDTDLQSTKDDVDSIKDIVTFPTDAADGTYVLKATVSQGDVTFAWVAEV